MEPSSEKCRQVLLVDSEAYVWDVVRHGLRTGYRTTAVAFRSAALRILVKHPPDLMIVDLRPDALGLSMCIYGLRRHIPVVMTTGNHDLARRLMHLGLTILHKPLSPAELRDCVEAELQNPDDNLLRHRAALERLRTDHREREAVLRLFGEARDEVLLALKSAHD
jgi:DNA-binding response OmpR family regulator